MNFKTRYVIYASGLLLYLSLAVLFVRNDPLTLPEPKGVYGVGTLNVELSDPARTQLRSRDKRRWMATVFYPTLKTKATAPYMTGTLKDGNVCGTKVFGHGIPGALMIQDRKFPIIISLPGRGGERQKETILYEALASHGYIVITMDQPYVANFVKFPDGTKKTLTFKDLRHSLRDRDYRYAYDDEIIASAIKDIDFVLEHVQDFGNISSAFDTKNIILMGHSIGANIAHIKGFSDKRVKAIVDINSKITKGELFGRIGVHPNPDAKPVLFIRGRLKHQRSDYEEGHEEGNLYEEEVGDQLTKISNSTIWTPKIEHSAFSDDAYFAAKIPNYGMGFWKGLYTWLVKKGPYFSTTDINLGDYKVDEWFEQYPEYIVKWLDKHIRR